MKDLKTMKRRNEQMKNAIDSIDWDEGEFKEYIIHKDGTNTVTEIYIRLIKK